MYLPIILIVGIIKVLQEIERELPIYLFICIKERGSAPPRQVKIGIT
jgi:hypothetical protein